MFGTSKFTGLKKFIVFTLVVNIICLLISVVYKFTIEDQLKQSIAWIYRIYYFSRILFISTGLMSMFCLTFSIYFIFNFEEVELPENLKLSLNESILQLPIEIKYFFVLNILIQILQGIALTHQISWHFLLDQSWCNNNHYTKMKEQEKFNKELNE